MSLSFIDNILLKGERPFTPNFHRRRTLLNRYCVVGIGASLVFALQYIILGYYLLGLYLLPVVCLLALSLYANKQGFTFLATNLLLSTVIVSLLFFVAIIGKNSGTHLLYFPIAFVAMSLIPMEKKWCIILYLSLIVGAYLGIELLIPDNYSNLVFSPSMEKIDYLITTILSLVASLLVGYNLLSVSYNIKDSLYHSQSQNKALLQGIPDQILLFNLEGTCLNYKGKLHEDAGDNRFIGQPISRFLSLNLSKKLMEVARHVIHKGQISSFEWESLSRGSRNCHEFRVIRVNREAVITIIREITDKKEQEADKKAKEFAENAFRSKSEFLSSMSHEIRTPMNIIMGLSKILLKDQKIQDQSRENLEAISFSAENLLVVVNDILDLSKIEAGKFSIDQTSFDLKNLMRKHVNFMQHESSGKQLQLELDIDDQIPDFLIGDPVRINQIMTNLTGNAIKYTRKGKVKVSLSIDSFKDKEVLVRFSVKDTGIGIPQDKLHYIFDSFNQVDQSGATISGTGLGLTISQKLVHLLKGDRIEVKSVIGLGSTFSFSLPFQLSQELQGSVEGKSEDPVFADLKGIKILLAEDNNMNQFYAKQLLSSWNVEVAVAGNGIEVIEMAKNEQYDLILMDLQMPLMDGFAALKSIREGKDLNARTPVVCVSADAFPETRAKAMENGMDDFLTKPLDEDTLFRIVNKFVKQAKPKICNSLKREVVKSQQLLKLENISPVITSDPETLSEFLNLFVTSAKIDLDKLSTAIILMEHEKIQAFAHKIKSSFRNVGALSSSELLQAIEHAASEGAKQEEMASLLRELLQHYHIIRTEIAHQIPNIA